MRDDPGHGAPDLRSCSAYQFAATALISRSRKKGLGDVTQTAAGDEKADEICRDCGYEPELKRSLNGFQIFAVAFASMSVVMGISLLRGHLPIPGSRSRYPVCTGR